MGKCRNLSPNDVALIASSYNSRWEFCQADAVAYRYALRFNIINDLFPSRKIIKWSRESVVVEASKYNSRNDFLNAARGAYGAAERLGLLDSLFGGRVVWNEDNIRLEASKYNSRSAFEFSSASAYNAALRIGLMDQLGFESRINGNDNNAIYIWRAVGQVYNGNPVYKIGVTSARLGVRRIEQVAKGVGFEFEVICCEAVQCKASDLEKKLLILGEDPRFSGFDGCTEFRALSDSALYAAISLICNQL